MCSITLHEVMPGGQLFDADVAFFRPDGEKGFRDAFKEAMFRTSAQNFERRGEVREDRDELGVTVASDDLGRRFLDANARSARPSSRPM